MTGRLLAIVAAAAAAAAAVALNLLLLGGAAASNDPVGSLTPRVHLPAAPHWVVRPRTGHPHDGGADD